jgi:hypothetical protein
MRGKLPDGPEELNELIDLVCEPGVLVERQAEARKLVQRCLGPVAGPVLRACDQAAGAKRERAAMAREMERYLTGPQLRAVVTATHNGRVRVAIGGAERELPRPPELTLAVGQTVLTDADGRAVLGAGEPLVGGQSFVFCELLEDRRALVRPLRESPHEDLRQVALIGDAVALDTLVPGDHVLGWSLDYGNLVLVTRRLGPLRAPVADDPGAPRPVRREDIIGLEDVLEKVDLLFLASDAPGYAELLAETEGSIVGYCFQGVTGAGKSLLAQCLMSEVRARGGRALARTSSYYLSKWVGEGSERLRADFAMLESAYGESGIRPLLVIDELEAIALDRNIAAGAHAGYLDVLDTLLHELTRTSARVIGISNVAGRLIDPALERDGRLPLLPFPPTLTAAQVAAIVAKRLARVSLAAGDARSFGEMVSDLVVAPDGPLATLFRVQLADGRVLTFGARDLASPAAIADGVVRPTLLRLVRRDLGASRPRPAPLTLDELRDATLAYFTQRAATITRESVRSVLGGRLPEDQAVIKVEALVHNNPRGREGT